jgi:hypothetical protein
MRQDQANLAANHRQRAGTGTGREWSRGGRTLTIADRLSYPGKKAGP